MNEKYDNTHKYEEMDKKLAMINRDSRDSDTLKYPNINNSKKNITAEEY